MVCDPVAVMCAINPVFVRESIQTHGSCITDEGETYAQVIFYKEGFTYDAVPNDYDHNVTLITQVDKENYFNLYLDYISPESVKLKTNQAQFCLIFQRKIDLSLVRILHPVGE